tara:strand:+ start:186 stop:431 length:246 start_codon:yes stop_codon:yes gene_type:complete
MKYQNLKYSIDSHIVCNKCIEELSTISSTDINLKNFVKFEVGFTSFGIQIWCIRHDINVCHINFDGNQFSADFRSLEFDNN